MSYFQCSKCGSTFDHSYTHCSNCDGAIVEHTEQLRVFNEHVREAATTLQSAENNAAQAVVSKSAYGQWEVRIGDALIGHWALSNDIHLTAEACAKNYAARVNAELQGGVSAFGCNREAKGNPRCVMRWCGSSECPVTLKEKT